MSVTQLIDNDVVIKLAQMDAFLDGMQSIGVKPGEVASLKAMLRFMGIADAARRERLTQSKAEADRLNDVLHGLVELEMTEEESRAATSVMKLVLQEGLDLDEGELALIVVASARGGLDVCSGDKRALRSLPALEKLWGAVKALRGRFVCLEQIFLRLCQLRGLPRVRDAVSRSPRADTAIAIAYEITASGGDKAFVKGMRMVLDEHLHKPAPGWLKTF